MGGTRALQLLPAQSATVTRQATWPRRRLRPPACRQLCQAACRPLLRRTFQLLRGLPQRQAHPHCHSRTISCSCHTRSCRRHGSQAAAQPALVRELLAFRLRPARRPPRSLQREWATPVTRRLVSRLWAHVRAWRMMRRVGLRALVGLHEKLWRGTVKMQARPSARDAQPAPAEHQAQRKRARRALYLLVRLLRMIRCPCAMLLCVFCVSVFVLYCFVQYVRANVTLLCALRLLSAAAQCALRALREHQRKSA